MARLVGVLAVQGGYGAHAEVLRSLGCEVRLVRRPRDLDGPRPPEALVLPGGESTAQARLLRSSGLWGALDARVRAGCPVLATCAGLILTARAIAPAGALPAAQDDAGLDPPTFGWLDVTVTRNGFGRQLDSRRDISDDGRHELVFIRAPRIVEVGPGVEVLARWRGEPVLVRQGAVLGATFHPELGSDAALHRSLLGGLREGGPALHPSASAG